MKLRLSIVLTILFFGLAAIHFYWGYGGQWGFTNSLPTNEQGVRILNPKTIDSIIVGSGLLLFGTFYLFLGEIIKIKIAMWFKNILQWLIPLIFILRAIGDFKYVGFFKEIKTTEFANLDTNFYSPLCLVIGFIGFIVLKLKK